MRAPAPFPQGWPAGYACLHRQDFAEGDYALCPVRWGDIESIRAWRNAQLDVLRQESPLTAADQEAYYREVVRLQMLEVRPTQLLFSFLCKGRLIGYGGLVHVSWPDNRAELSFLVDSDRATTDHYKHDFAVFIRLIVEVAGELQLHRLTTETFAFRTDHMKVLNRAGFEEEGRLRDHVRLGGRYVDSILHGLLIGGSDHAQS